MTTVRLMGWMSACLLFGTSFAMANEAGGAVAATGGSWGPLAAAIAISVAAFGGALGQGKAAAAGLEGIARNPSVFGKLIAAMIVGLALIESLVIYALLIAFKILG